MTEALRLLAIAAAMVPRDHGHFEVERVASVGDALLRLAAGPAVDVVLADSEDLARSADEIDALAASAALVIVVENAGAEESLAWLRHGVEDLLGRDEVRTPAGARRLRFAAVRKRRGQGTSSQYSTDDATGLPHRRQLVEHLSQLLALREREPSPMAVVALRVALGAAPGRPATAAEIAALPRRKIAVRLRAGVRSSDIVAAVDEVTFAVLLGSILSAADAERVAAKLVASLTAPISAGGIERTLDIACGLAHYPQDGNDAERLVSRALALAVAAPVTSGAGPAIVRDSNGGLRAAANDEG